MPALTNSTSVPKISCIASTLVFSVVTVCSRPPLEVVWPIRSQCILGAFTTGLSCGETLSDHPKPILIEGVKGASVTNVDCYRSVKTHCLILTALLSCFIVLERLKKDTTHQTLNAECLSFYSTMHTAFMWRNPILGKPRCGCNSCSEEGFVDLPVDYKQ